MLINDGVEEKAVKRKIRAPNEFNTQTRQEL